MKNRVDRMNLHPVFLAVLAAFPLFATAQDAVDGEAKLLGTVTVNAYQTTRQTSGATKTETPLAETAQSVSVVAREELDARGVRNLNDAMRYVAGVALESTGIDNRVDDFSIRGFDAGSWGNNVTIDGMRAPQGSQWNRTMVDSWNLERVEVLKGPAAVMYGQVAPGGMVNQVSKTPNRDRERILRLGIDGHGQYNAAFDLGGGSDDDRHLFRLVGLVRQGDTQIKHTEEDHSFIAPSYTFKVSDATKLTLLGLYQRDHGGSTYQFLPMAGTLVPTQYGRIKNDAFIGEPDWNTYNRTIWTAGYFFEHAFNDRWKFSQSARLTDVRSLFRTVVTNGALNADGRTQNRRAVWGEGDSRGYTVDTRLTGKFTTGLLEHTLLTGLDWQKADWSGARGAMNNPGAIDIFNPVFSYFTPVTTTITHLGGVNRQTGFYLQDQIAVDKWRLTLGGRYDWAKDDTWTQTQTVATNTWGARAPTHVRSEAFTRNAGLLYIADSGFSPYVSFAESFQPSGNNADLNAARKAFDPVTGEQWEIGVKYQPKGIDGLVTLSAYDLRQQNILLDDTGNLTCGPAGTTLCKIQGGESQVRGVELEGRVTLSRGFSVIGAMSWMDSEVTRGTPALRGKELARVPEKTVSLWGDYTFHNDALAGLSLATGVRYNGKSYGDSANAFRIPSYTLWDAAIRYVIGRDSKSPVQLALNVSNLTDKQYISTCGTVASCYYGTGRTVNATATFNW